MAIYLTGSPLAALVSFVVGGWLNEMYGWRLTFFLMGILGLLLAVVVKLTLVEPRSGASSVLVQSRAHPPMRIVLNTLWRQRSCRHLSISLILLYTMSLGLAPWYAAFMIRSHAMSTTELGVWLGLIFGLGGATGTLLGGYVAGRWFGGNERGAMRMCALSVAALVPCFAAFLLLPHKHQALIALIPLIAVFNLFLGPTYAFMQRLVAVEMRATMLAVVMLLANVIGMGVGPQVVGVLSDVLTPALGTDALRYAMLSMTGVALWGGYHFWKVGESVDQDLQMSAQTER
jgi:predicted MFS family arabinose efflux permease